MNHETFIFNFVFFKIRENIKNNDSNSKSIHLCFERDVEQFTKTTRVQNRGAINTQHNYNLKQTTANSLQKTLSREAIAKLHRKHYRV